jgi:predicted transcriptional regulator of viral defense system
VAFLAHDVHLWRTTRARPRGNLVGVPFEPSFDPSYGGKTTAGSWDRAIVELADRQHGVVARRQLKELGMTRRAIDGRLGRGSLHRVHRGVYAVGRRGLDREGQWRAALLACGPQAVLSHQSAGQLWGLLAADGGPVETTRPGRPRTRRPGIVTHESELRADEVAFSDGIPVTAPSRTIFDLAAMLSKRRLERAMNEADVRRFFDRVSLPQLLERYPGRPGAVNLRILLAKRSPGGVTRNEFEEIFAELLGANDLPRPRFNADLALRGLRAPLQCCARHSTRFRVRS